VSEQLIDLLKLCLLALLYLFFLRVMWAVWAELRTPATVAVPRTAPRRARVADRNTARAPAPTGAPAASTSTATLVVVEPADRAGRRYPVTSEMTLGRAPGCSIVVDDTFVSQIHARVSVGPDGVKLEDLGSTNGTMCNGDPVIAPRRLRSGDRIGLGAVVLELQ